MRSSLFSLSRALVLPLLLAAGIAQAQGHVTTPKQHFGHEIGDDYWLPNYDQYESYVKTIARESNRATLVEIGKTAEGRTQYTLIVSAPENIKNLEHYRQIEARLARAEGLTDAQARQLAAEGKAVVWIDGGLHATEVLGASQLIQTEYDLLTRTDPETMRILRDDIVLMTNVNPDGMQLVADWYMQESDSLKRNENIPRLYEKYAGHDDNRDFYMANLPETQNEEKVMFWEWYPDHRLQPPPDRSRRLGGVHAALPRSVQLRVRPAARHGHRHGGRRPSTRGSRPRASRGSPCARGRATRPGGTAGCGRRCTSTT